MIVQAIASKIVAPRALALFEIDDIVSPLSVVGPVTTRRGCECIEVEIAGELSVLTVGVGKAGQTAE